MAPRPMEFPISISSRCNAIPIVVSKGVKLIADLGLPGTLQAVGVRADQLDTIATGAMHDRWVHTNPRKIDGPAVVRTLLDVAW